MSKDDLIVAVYKSDAETKQAVQELQHAGFDMRKLSIVGREYHTEEHVTGYYNAGDRMKCWGTLGVFWGGMWGLLLGAAFFVVPGLGLVLVAGPLVESIVSALDRGVVGCGLTAIGAGLYSTGIPKPSVLDYEAALKADQFLLLAQGTANEIASAREIIQGTAIVFINIHHNQEFPPASVA